MKKAILFTLILFFCWAPAFGQIVPHSNSEYNKLTSFIYKQIDSAMMADSLTHTFSINGVFNKGELQEIGFSTVVPTVLKEKLMELRSTNIDWSKIIGKVKMPTNIIIPVFIVKDGRSVIYLKDGDDLFSNIFIFKNDDYQLLKQFINNTIVLRPIYIRKYIGPKIEENFKAPESVSTDKK